MKLNNTKTLLSLMIAMTVFIFSCQKENNTTELSTGNAIVNVKMSGIGPEDGSKLAKASIGGSSTAANAVQQVAVPFGEDLVIRATLTEVKASQGTALRASSAKAATTSVGAGEIVAFNGDYKIYIYKEGSSTLEKTVDGKGVAVNKFELAPGKYKFVVSAYGNPAGTGADKDPLSMEILQTVTAGNNNLDVVLKHKLTEVTVKFDAGSGRTINAISNSTVKPNYNYTFDEATGAVTFGTELAAKGFTFPTQAAAQTWTSTPVLIAVDNSNGAGEVKLANVTINNKAGNVSLTGLTLKKGVQYVLELNLGAKQGFEIGGHIWAPGNLVYNNGKYSFAAPNQLGSNWYYNWLTPFAVGTTPVDHHDMLVYSVDRDPCKMVSAEWRTPTKEDFNSLLATAGAATDYQYKYNGTEGVFYGSNNLQAMSADPTKYMFFPSITSGTSPYWTSTNIAYPVKDGSNANSLQFGGYNKPSTVSSDDNKTNGFQIRCVKN